MKQLLLPLSLCGLCVHTAQAAQLADCVGTADDAARLACYDDLAASGPGVAVQQENTGELTEEAVTAQVPDDVDGAPAAAESAEGRPELLVAQRLKIEEESTNNPWVITPHYRNYILPFTYNHHANTEGLAELGSPIELDKSEAKFQISLKALLWKNVLGKNTNIWAAYTQENWWQLYNFDESSSFRETNYQPEIILAIENDWEFWGYRNTLVSLSMNHQSNGRIDPLSRSWNRIIGSFLLERDRMSLTARAWYRIPENEDDDDNPNMYNYYGYGDLAGTWKWNDQEFSVTVRNNLRSDNKGSVQLDWVFPLNERFSGYVQYFNGYGESLIDYDEHTSRIGIGFALTNLL